VAANVLQFGTGALNIDACRVPHDEQLRAGAGNTFRTMHAHEGRAGEASAERRYADAGGDAAGRWPANLIHDGSDEVLAAFPNAPGQQGRARTDGGDQGNNTFGALRHVTHMPEPRGDTGTAARFFYCAKASRKDRDEGLGGFVAAAAGVGDNRPSGGFNERMNKGSVTMRANTHPTVKPTELMRYLVRLVTPLGGCVLDPFAGSGSTGKACALEGFVFIGFELDKNFTDIANARILAAA
jgi:site-specific DNA-methyltransferase (adenine-specific)